jgi:predicted Zn-dependent protease
VNTPARLAVTLPAVAALGWLAFAAARAGAADAIVYDASREMGTWAASHAQPGEQTWSWVHESLERAVAVIPESPTVHELLGDLEARSGRPEYAEKALVHFTRAVELRPTSPYTWADIADLKYRIGDTGAVFERALVRSAELGPAEPEVQQTVADLGLAVWKEAAPETRAAVEEMVAAGLWRNPMEMLQIARRRGRLDVACRHLPDLPRQVDPKWSQLCQSTEATS